MKMSDRKKRKYNDDYQIFNEKWSINYFSLKLIEKPFVLCVVKRFEFLKN
jgi:hypothetical protein